MKRIALLSLMLILLVPSTAFGAKRVALVIGNGAYRDAPLRNPVNDASDMAKALKKLGFSVTLLTNSDRERWNGPSTVSAPPSKGATWAYSTLPGMERRCAGPTTFFP